MARRRQRQSHPPLLSYFVSLVPTSGSIDGGPPKPLTRTRASGFLSSAMAANPIRSGVGAGAAFARSLARRRDRAALATIQRGEGLDGAPYASLVLLALDVDASPLFYLSDLAQHTKNLKSDARASLLIDSPAPAPDVLAAPRLTLVGEIRPADDARRLQRFMARHPSSVPYAGFGDFRLYGMTVARAH